jgi:uncharacterized protein HemX
MSRIAVALAGLALLAVVAFGILGYAVLAGRLNDLEARTDENQTQITENETQIAENAEALEESGKAQVAEMDTKLTALTRRMNRITDCLPELNNVVNSLGIETTDTEGYLTSASSRTIFKSHACVRVSSRRQAAPAAKRTRHRL